MHPFYLRLLSHVDISEANIQQIATHIIGNSLLVCSDGSYEKLSNQAYHGWAFGVDLQPLLVLGVSSGPVDGHHSSLSPFRAELSGIIAVLYLIQHITSIHNISQGTITFYCDSTSALRNVFQSSPAAFPSYKKADTDLIPLAHRLLRSLPIIILHQGIKGHNEGSHPTAGHLLNRLVHEQANTFRSQHQTLSIPLQFPHFAVRLITGSSVITANLYQALSTCLHRRELKRYLLSKYKWVQ